MPVAHGDTVVAVRDDVEGDVVVVNAGGAGVDAGEAAVAAGNVVVNVVVLRLLSGFTQSNESATSVRVGNELSHHLDREKGGGRFVPKALHRAKPLPQTCTSKRFVHARREDSQKPAQLNLVQRHRER